eukprot:gene56673-biopygen22804
MDIRAAEKYIRLMERIKRLPKGSPAKDLAPKLPKPKFADEIWHMTDMDATTPEPFPTRGDVAPWEEPPNVTFHHQLVEEVTRDDPSEIRKAAVEKTIDQHGEVTLQIATDGSVEGGTRKGGSAAVFKDKLWRHVERRAAGEFASSYQAELIAIQTALEQLKRMPQANKKRTLLVTDSQAAVRRLARGADGQSQQVACNIWGLLVELFPEKGEDQLIIQF